MGKQTTQEQQFLQTIRQERISQIRHLPAQIENLVDGLTDAQLTNQSIPGEWTVAQNVHHLVDSHMNSYVRCKLMATEDNPPLKPYDQDAWAQFPDASAADVTGSLQMLRALHERWAQFWESLSAKEFARTGVHPVGGTVTLDDQLALYVEHGLAHVEQIERTIDAGKS